MKKHLYLIRHGETLFNQRKKIQGWCDSPLTKKGIEQAQAAALLIKDINFDHYYSSTSERCCDTLEIITNHQVPYVRLKQLKERNFEISNGYGELKEKTFRISHMGDYSTNDVLDLLNNINEILGLDNNLSLL